MADILTPEQALQRIAQKALVGVAAAAQAVRSEAVLAVNRSQAIARYLGTAPDDALT